MTDSGSKAAVQEPKEIFFFADYLVISEKKRTFAAEIRTYHLGLTGFDGKMRWYVSTRRLAGSLLNLSLRKINWRNKIRSRCLIEVQ